MSSCSKQLAIFIASVAISTSVAGDRLPCVPTPSGSGSYTPAIAIEEWILSDNGDSDAYADTRETISLRMRLRNATGVALAGVTARLWTDAPALACVSGPWIAVGDLAAGETRTPDAAFVVTLPGIDRPTGGMGVFDDLSATFRVAFEAEPGCVVEARPLRHTFDLDLDVTGGSGETAFFESFEGTLGAFQIQNLDAGKNSLAASDGYRCQYSDPDNPDSIVYGGSGASTCYLGYSANQANAVYWSLSGPAFSSDGGRAVSGTHSLYFGIDLGSPEFLTTPHGVLEGVRTALPINLPADGPAPRLKIRHQVSMADERLVSGIGDLPVAHDRTVVMAQVADTTGAGVGPWVRLEPSRNPYDLLGSLGFPSSCVLDPVDDDSTEDDLDETLGGTVGAIPAGPSSSCWPEYVFGYLGETMLPFDSSRLGNAEGPGIAGSWGPGTWVESEFDLSRFRGRRIRVRLLASTMKTSGGSTTWEEMFALNPDPRDDGWWIDDVSIEPTLTVPAVLSVDAKDNAALPIPPDGDLDGVLDTCDNCFALDNPLQADADLDGIGDACDVCPDDPANFDPDLDLVCGGADNCPYEPNPDQADGDLDGAGTVCDCDDANDAVHPGASEINDGLDNECPGDPGSGLVDDLTGPVFFNGSVPPILIWSAQLGASLYQVARADAVDFTSGCTTWLTPQPGFDPGATAPVESAVWYYLVRARSPGAGSWGADSAGTERNIPCQ